MQNKRFINTVNILMLLTIFLSVIPGLFTQSKPINANATNFRTYYVSMLLDPTNTKIQGVLREDSHAITTRVSGNAAFEEWQNTHMHYAKTDGTPDYAGQIIKAPEKGMGDLSNISQPDKSGDYKKNMLKYIKSTMGKTYEEDNPKLTWMALSFPGNPAGLPNDAASAPGQSDITKANSVTNTLLADYNTAINLYYNKESNKSGSPYKPDDNGNITQAQMALLALQTASLPSNTFSQPSKVKNGKQTVTVKGTNTKLVYGQSKGYTNTRDKKADFSGGANGILNWQILGLNAVGNWITQDLTYDNAAKVSRPDKLTAAITNFLYQIPTQLTTLLGIPPLTDLIFNQGGSDPDNGSFYGIGSGSWFKAVNIMFYAFYVIAFMIIIFAMSRMLYIAQTKLLNTNQRLNVIDDIKSLVISLGTLFIYPFLFLGLTRLNYLLVKMFFDMAKTTGSSDIFYKITQSNSNGQIVGAVILMFVLLILNIYFYYFYTFRMFMITALHVMSPVYIASISLGGKYIETFTGWIKELLGNIFIQAFQAMVVAMLALISINGGGIHLLQTIFGIAAIIPISKWIRNSLNIGGNYLDEMSNNTLGKTGAALAGMMTAFGSSNRRNGGGGGGFGNNSFNNSNPLKEGTGTNVKGTDNFGQTLNARSAVADGGKPINPLSGSKASLKNAGRTLTNPRSYAGAVGTFGKAALNTGGKVAGGVAKAAVIGGLAAGEMAVGSRGDLTRAGIQGMRGLGNKWHSSNLGKKVDGLGDAFNDKMHQPKLIPQGIKQENANKGALKAYKGIQPKEAFNAQPKPDMEKAGVSAQMPGMEKAGASTQMPGANNGKLKNEDNMTPQDVAEANVSAAALTSNLEKGGVTPSKVEEDPTNPDNIVETYDSNDFAKQTGINSLQSDQGNDNITANYDYDYDKGRMNDPSLNNSQYGHNINKAVDAFKNNDVSGMAKARANGINNVGRTDDGKMAMQFSKQKMGVQSITSNGSQIKVQRSGSNYTEGNSFKGQLSRMSADDRKLGSSNAEALQYAQRTKQFASQSGVANANQRQSFNTRMGSIDSQEAIRQQSKVFTTAANIAQMQERDDVNWEQDFGQSQTGELNQGNDFQPANDFNVNQSTEMEMPQEMGNDTFTNNEAQHNSNTMHSDPNDFKN